VVGEERRWSDWPIKECEIPAAICVYFDQLMAVHELHFLWLLKISLPTSTYERKCQKRTKKQSNLEEQDEENPCGK
jgi:hypothetical protein